MNFEKAFADRTNDGVTVHVANFGDFTRRVILGHASPRVPGAGLWDDLPPEMGMYLVRSAKSKKKVHHTGG
jgi:hypothetical protein